MHPLDGNPKKKYVISAENMHAHLLETIVYVRHKLGKMYEYVPGLLKITKKCNSLKTSNITY